MGHRLDEHIARIRERRAYSFDVEHAAEATITDKDFSLWGMSFSYGDYTEYLTDPEEISYFVNTLFPEEVLAIAHNCKYDMRALVSAGHTKLYPKYVFDTMIAANLLDDNLHPNQLGLKDLVLQIFKHAMTHYEDAAKYGKNSPEFKKYAEEDAYWEFQLYTHFAPILKQRGMYKYILTVPANQFFADVETTGFPVDSDKFWELTKKTAEIRDDRERMVFKSIGYLNLGSPKQLQQRLFVDLQYDTAGIPTTPTGQLSTDEEAITILASKYPACAHIRDFRSASKLLSTYLVPMAEYALKNDGVVRGKFWLVSSTGRTRCSDFNLQNLPTAYDGALEEISVRDAFVAFKDHVLLVADLSNLELRLMGQISNDPVIVDAFRSWQCLDCGATGQATRILHSCPNCGAEENEDVGKGRGESGFYHGRDLHTETSRIPVLRGDRQLAKVANFALIYGATAYRMHHEHPMTGIQEWTQIIDQFMVKYKGVDNFHKLLWSKIYAGKTFEVCDPFGRVRTITSRMISMNKKHAFNQAANFGCQAGGCAVAQRACTAFRNKIRAIPEYEWMNLVRPVNMVHDELVISVHRDIANPVARILQDAMELTDQLIVPMRANVNICDKWSDGK